MDRNGFLTVSLFFLIVSDLSSAYPIWGRRNLSSGLPKENSTATNLPPVPSPVTNTNDTKANQNDATRSGKDDLHDHRPSNNSGKENMKGSNNGKDNLASAPPPPRKQTENEKSQGGQQKTDNKTNSELQSNLSCNGSTNHCRFKTIIACFQSFDSGNKDLLLLVQNDGENTVDVDITVSTSLKTDKHEISIHQTETINISWTIGQSPRILVITGDGNCTLHMDPPLSGGHFLQRLPSYYKKVTPIYIAYSLFLISLVVGGTCACCQLRKRRQDGVPYQELEMGLPGSPAAVNETAEGWDAVWDDDWDEEMAVKSPGGNHAGNISANGLTARTSNRDGWEKDWDD